MRFGDEIPSGARPPSPRSSSSRLSFSMPFEAETKYASGLADCARVISAARATCEGVTVSIIDLSFAAAGQVGSYLHLRQDMARQVEVVNAALLHPLRKVVLVHPERDLMPLFGKAAPPASSPRPPHRLPRFSQTNLNSSLPYCRGRPMCRPFFLPSFPRKRESRF